MVNAASAVSALPQPVADHPAPHIALLLPLKSRSSALARAAEVVQQGFIAASNVQRGLPVRIYPCTDETKESVNLYRQAIANGAGCGICRPSGGFRKNMSWDQKM